jgi:hypothetical protein
MTEDRALGVLDAAVGVSAIGGASYALSGAKEWPIEWLDGTPFRSYRIPGLILGGIHAPLDIAAGVALVRGSRNATPLALASSAVQVGWIVVQWRIIGRRSVLQPLMGVIGVVSLVGALRRVRRERCAGE